MLNKLLRVGLIGALLCVVTALPAAEPPPKDAVRVLIDVSGSMKKTDPHHLRTPALRLLVNLLPPDSRAGIWHFAQYVNRVTPVGNADPAWRRKALAAADSIHSRGLFTDIGAALRDATEDWQTPDPSVHRSIILLTDGKVDVSKKPGANATARRAIIDEVIPRLQKARVSVHTIALSPDADRALMEKLSTSTDGEYFQVDTSEQLQRIFLKLFEQTVQRDTVPIKGNHFRVDDQIREMTLLAFRGGDDAPTRLATPGGEIYKRVGAPDSVRWFHERGYDLITVEDPQPGQWTLMADVDPDNRVMIVTDLQLRTSRLPSNVIAGEQLKLTAELTNKGETITREDFLDLVKLSVTQTPESSSQGPRWVLQDNGLGDDAAAGDGQYTLVLQDSLTAGKQLLAVRAASPTFSREARQRMTVYPHPLDIQEVSTDTGKRLRIAPAIDWIDTATLQLSATVTRADGTSRHARVAAEPKGGYILALPETAKGQPVKVTLAMDGKTVDGRRFSVELPPRSVLPEPAATKDPSAPAKDPQKQHKTNWVFIGSVVLAVNVAVFGLLGIGYLLWSSRKRKEDPSLSGAGEDVPSRETGKDD